MDALQLLHSWLHFPLHTLSMQHGRKELQIAHRLLRGFSSKQNKLQHQLRLMCPGGEMVRRAIQDLQSSMKTSFATSEERMNSGRVRMLVTIWPWVSAGISPYKNKPLQ